MPNILTWTEAFDNAAWGSSSTSVTANTHAAPAFAGPDATMADTVEDTSAVAQGFHHQTKAKGSDDTANWIVSVFVRKDAITARVPQFSMQFRDGGTFKDRGVRLNTSTGATGFNAGGTQPPVDHGVVDVDANWWRLWMKEPDNASANLNLRFAILPALSTSVTGPNDATLTGSVVVWGANVVKADAVSTYEPDPFYEFEVSEWVTLDTLGALADAYSDTTVEGGQEYDYRVLAANSVGSSPSNIVTETAVPGAGSVTFTMLERMHRGLFRGTHQ